ncbi:MAG: CoA transferase [Propionibacteriaceae bacterium]|nr:CoA transferase [Propionibacteriaceae bacterium]
MRVLDLTSVVMGPFATQILGDLGAEVIKVEPPQGDSLRGVGPWRNIGMGPLYLQNNRNKASVVLDLKTDDGQAALHELIGSVDVLISNIRPDAMRRLGLTNEAIRALNPSIITCNAVGYGSGGPLSGKAVYDDLMQAASGVAGLFGAVDGRPRYAPVNIGDRVSGLYIVIAVEAALFERARNGGAGQDIEVPMFETMAQFVLSDHMGGAAFVPALGDMGYPRLLSSHRGPYPTADGHLTVVVYTNPQWARFLELVGDPDLMVRDQRFADQRTRTIHADEVGQYLETCFVGRTTAEWLDLLARIDVPASPVNSIEDLLTDEHLNQVGFFTEYDHPTEGRIKTTRFPVEFSRTPATDFSPPSALGADTARIQPAPSGVS